MTKKVKISKTKFYQITTVVLAIILMGVVVFGAKNFTGISTSTLANSDKVGTSSVEFLNENFGTSAEVMESTESNGMYYVKVNVDGEETELYVSPDGKLIFPFAIDTEETLPTADAQPTQTPSEVPKSSMPVVQLFVMSHCPYGTQIEKGILPVVEQLGDKIDFELKFVSYAMHGEVELNEQLNQYCIQKEQNDKFLDYIGCFLEDGDSARCVTKVGVDQALLDTCVAAADEEFNVSELFADKSTWSGGSFPQFNAHLAENIEYGVQGSPTLVINDVVVSSGRDSASLLGTICSAFDNPPAECSEEISSAPPSPGFGYNEGVDTIASCG